MNVSVLQDLRDWLSRRLKSKPANIICDEEFLKEFPKIKRRKATIYKIVKQIISDNDKWYVKYNRDSDTYYIGKEDEKTNFISSSKNKQKKKRRMRKRKNKESIDEISQGLLMKQIRKKNCSKKNIANCSPRNRTKKNKRKTKVKVEIKTEIKPPKLPRKETIKAPKRKRKNQFNIDEISKKPKTKKTIKKTFHRTNN